ncbi:hypothetical protein HD806DRAFT_552583 [Xylariaceae sp. AK1471]|nr:hypothetical protein HD806DRAFT_552583 [Xylariaceae sp. AK1471]
MNSQMDVELPSSFPYPVYIGLWTNWSYGKFIGSTLTLGRDNANLLIGAITFFITIVAVHIWKIICFSLHAYYSDPSPRDGLYHQRQAIIRNSSSAAGALLTLINLIWTWRKVTKSWLRLLPILVLTALTAIALAIASIFASRVATGSEVLLAGSGCGMVVPDLSDTSLTEVFTDYTPYLADSLNQAATYASQCYEGSSSSSMGCGVFVKPRLKAETTDENAPCPFSSMCKTEDSNLLIDTGLLNSHYDFGINAPENERFLFRMAVACAPLKSEGFSKIYNVSQDRSYTQYFYGHGTNNDYTFAASNDAFYELSVTNVSSFTPDYSIGLGVASLYNGTLAVPPTTFEPIPEILGQNRDVFIVFLSAGGVLFLNETLDPWYNATKPVSLHFLSGQDRVIAYRQDQAASTLACTYQEQYCLAPFNKKESCTPLGPSLDVRQLIQESASNEQVSRQIKWSIAAAQNLEPNPLDVVDTLGPQALVSRRTLLQGEQGYLPPDQWKTEVQHWFDISLAALQNAYVKTAAGPPSSIHEAAIQRPANDVEKKLCRSQKVISTDYVSFSFLGLMIIFVLGLIIIIVSFSLELLASCIQRRWKKGGHRRLEWITNGTLQLQRLVHEELGIGEWEDCDAMIPVTRQLDDLALLDLTDEKHPRLMPQHKEIMDPPRHQNIVVNSDSSSAQGTENSESYLVDISGEPHAITTTSDDDTVTSEPDDSTRSVRAGIVPTDSDPVPAEALSSARTQEITADTERTVHS